MAKWAWIGIGFAALVVASWSILSPGPDDLATSPAPSEQEASTAVAVSPWAALGTTPACDETESHSYIPDGVRDYSCRFMKTLSLAALEQMAGVPVFVSGPHGKAALNLESYRFGHYNPQFVTWATEHLVPDVTTLPASIRERLKDGALTYYRVNGWLAQHPDVMKSLRTSYDRAVRDAPPDPEPGGEGPRGYNGPASDILYGNGKLRGPDFVSWDATVAAGFWVRREIDGTRPLFAAALDKLLRAVDSTFTPTAAAPVADAPVAARSVVAPAPVFSEPAMIYTLASGRGSGGRAIAISPNGRQVALASNGTLLRAWGTGSGALQYSVRSGTGAADLVYTRDGRLLAVASYDNSVRVVDAATGATRFASPADGKGNMLAAVFSADGQTLVTGGTDPSLHVWDVATGQLQRKITGHTSNLLSLALSPDGRLLASSSADGTLKLWNAADFSLVASLAIGRGMSIAFSPSGRQLAVGQYEGQVQVVDVAARTTASTIRFGIPVLDLAWSPDGRRLASAVGDSVIINDVATGDRRYVIATREATGVAWSPDGARLAISQSNQGTKLLGLPK